MKEYMAKMATPIGEIGLLERDGALAALYLPGEVPQGTFPEGKSEFLARVTEQLEEYFAGRRRAFDVRMALGGTAFQRLCWDALCEIPFGETRTYAQIAERIGHPTAYRAVGSSNHRNPIPILIPCHRVIGKSGGLTGYRGGIPAKEILLRIEGRG